MKVLDTRSIPGFHNSRVCLRTQLRERCKPVLYMEISKRRIILQLCCFEQQDCCEQRKAVVKLGCSLTTRQVSWDRPILSKLNQKLWKFFKMLSCYNLPVWRTATWFGGLWKSQRFITSKQKKITGKTLMEFKHKKYPYLVGFVCCLYWCCSWLTLAVIFPL